MKVKPVLLIAAIATALALPATAGAAPGGYTQDQVNQAIQSGVTYIGGQQNSDGSFGSSFPEAETALALISYGVLDGGDTSKLSAAERDQFTKGVDWLLSQQAADGSWGGFLGSYSTGLALLAFSYAGDLQSPTRDIASAIAKGRQWLIMTQNAPPSVTGNTANNTVPGIPGPSPDCTSDGSLYPGNSTPTYCGGWNYNASFGRSDQSNTGFALTGLAATGGVPGPTAQVNIGWQRNVQMLATNPFNTQPFALRNGQPANDGGASYEPGITTGDFASNANDTGSLIFGFAYDGVPGTDAGVQAGIKFGVDVLDVYELSKDQPGGRTMAYHTGVNEDGACLPGTQDCTWSFAPGEGGYHYSMFALSKGLGHYLPSDLTDAGNFYAKVVDLLLSQQSQDGSWPADLRDDGSPLGAAAFSIMSLGRVGQPAIASGTVFNDANGNGTRDAGEAGLAGWVVYVDANGNGTRDAGEPAATTGSGGTYTIQGIAEGKASVRIEAQQGFNCTAPAGCAFPDIQFRLGDNRTGLDFGERQPPVVVPQGGPVVTPNPRQCRSRRAFTITVRKFKRYKFVKVRITVNGKHVKVVKRHGRFKARVDLKLLRRGRYVVRITAITKDGKVLHGTRRYRTCTKRRPHTTPPL